MNRSFSFYEFAGIIAPSVIFLFFLNLVIDKAKDFSLFDFSKIGESVIFIVIAYGVGHIIQSFGNYAEKPVWWLLNGMPTEWITKQPRLWQNLFKDKEKQLILEKLQKDFGDSNALDYGRLAFTKVHVEGKTDRIETFNGNYSLFRGLLICFLFLMIITIYLGYYDWFWLLLLLVIMSTLRMIHFGKCYAREVYRTYFFLKN
ncbi:hypothetical protein [Haliscomenobacter sp.]|uniref:hypothetical protein n=1 Tax=Haliscomenobacter sp. TaxID=2717303 RepID=UPI003BAA99A9